VVLKIDIWLLALAKKILTIASFFGITRWQVIVGWILLAYFTTFIITCNDLLFSLIVMPPNVWVDYKLAKFYFRDDDVLANDLVLLNPHIRLARVSLYGLLWFVIVPPNMHFLRLLMIPDFYLYFVLNQGPRSKITLRGLVKNVLAKARALLTPQPAPQPAPSCLSVPRS
jgi:hypothetical protein